MSRSNGTLRLGPVKLALGGVGCLGDGSSCSFMGLSLDPARVLAIGRSRGATGTRWFRGA